MIQDFEPIRLPAAGGHALIASGAEQYAYDNFGYAAARIVGSTLYVSGVVTTRQEGEGTDADAFRAQARRSIAQLENTLKAAGLTFDDVVMINSFHVWDSADFDGKPFDQIMLINQVRAEMGQAPHPAWTAVGTTGLLIPNGIVEIQLMAHMRS